MHVTRFAIGDHVVNSIMPNWFGGSFQAIPQQYGIHLDGWLREYRVVSEEELVIMPSFLSFTKAATLPCAAVMAWSALAGVGPREVVLTQGTGGVSLFAVRFAKAAGAKVVATTGEPMRETHNWPFATLPRLPTSDTYLSPHRPVLAPDQP